LLRLFYSFFFPQVQFSACQLVGCTSSTVLVPLLYQLPVRILQSFLSVKSEWSKQRVD
jgi:hypothetical protein